MYKVAPKITYQASSADPKDSIPPMSLSWRIPGYIWLPCFRSLLYLRQLPSLPLPFVSLTLLKNASQLFCRLPMLPQDESTLYNLGRSMSLQEKRLRRFLHSSHPDLGYFHQWLGKMFCSYVGEPSNRWEKCSKKGCTQFCK